MKLNTIFIYTHIIKVDLDHQRLLYIIIKPNKIQIINN